MTKAKSEAKLHRGRWGLGTLPQHVPNEKNHVQYYVRKPTAAEKDPLKRSKTAFLEAFPEFLILLSPTHFWAVFRLV